MKAVSNVVIGIIVVAMIASTYFFGDRLMLSFQLPPSFNKFIEVFGPYQQSVSLSGFECPSTYNNQRVFGCTVEFCYDFNTNISSKSCKNFLTTIEILSNSRGNGSYNIPKTKINVVNITPSPYLSFYLRDTCENTPFSYDRYNYKILKCYYRVFDNNNQYVKEFVIDPGTGISEYLFYIADVRHARVEKYYEILPQVFAFLNIYTEKQIICGDGVVSPGEECEPPGKRLSCEKDGKTGYRECLPTCVFSTCIVRICEPRERKCEGNKVFVCSDDGMSWKLETECEKGCVNGFCKICNYGEKKCEGKNLLSCNVDGMSYTVTYCQFGCSNGNCLTACENPNYKQCNPGQVEIKNCSLKCGVSQRICNQDCTWGNWSQCIEKSCIPGTETSCTMPDGRPGIRKCGNNCEWEPCISTAECTPGATEPCEKCGIRRCQSNGFWGPCENMKQCNPGELVECTNAQGCKKTVICTNSCTIPSCPQDECIPFTKRSCSKDGIPGEQICLNTCTWSSCIQTGVCKPGEQKPCGECGIKTCNANGFWGECKPFESKCGDWYTCTLR